MATNPSAHKHARRLAWRIRRDKKLSGANSLPIIIAYIFGAIMLTFVVAAVVSICFNGLRLSNIIHYLFAALQISYPFSDESPEGMRMVHVVMYLLMGVITMVLLPFFTAALNNLLNQNILEVQEGRKVYRNMSDHCVVIGYNTFAIQIIRRMLTGNNRFAIILTLQKAVDVRESLSAMLSAELEQRVIIYAGDAVSPDKIRDLCLDHAAEACLLEEATDHSSYYTRNLTILGNISEASVTRTTPVKATEMEARMRFGEIGRAVQARMKDLSKITADQAAFAQQKDQPGGKKTMMKYLWSLEAAKYDQEHNG